MSKKQKKPYKLLAEPQPVFVGGCFALVMLLMQFYIFAVAPNGELVSMLNSPLALIGLVFSEERAIDPVLWSLQTAAPAALLIFALIFGKRRACLLTIPAAIPALRGGYALITSASYTAYYINYALYILTFVFYFITASGIIKTIKPFIAYTIILCAGICILSLLGLPPFVLFDKSLFLSDMVYFMAYHIALANFARAAYMQRKKFGSL